MAGIVDAITDFVRNIGERFIDGVSGILLRLLLALVIIFIGYCIALFIGHIVKKLFYKMNLDKWIIDKTHLSVLLGKFKFSDFFATVTKWSIFIMFLSEAADITYLDMFSSVLSDLARWIPQLILAIFIGLFGLGAIDYVVDKIRQTNANSAGLFVSILKPILMILLLLLVFQQLGLNLSLANSSFLIVLGGIMLGLSLAVGIGFGLALKDEAKSVIKNLKKKI